MVQILGYELEGVALLLAAVVFLLAVYMVFLRPVPVIEEPVVVDPTWVSVSEIKTGLLSAGGHVYRFKPDSVTTCYVYDKEDAGGISCIRDMDMNLAR